MKKTSIIVTILLLAVFFLFAAGSGEDATDATSKDVEQPKETVTSTEAENVVTPTEEYEETVEATEPEQEGVLGDYIVEIDSCRMAKDYEGKPIVIVKYIFTNVSDDSPAAFLYTFDAAVYQNGIGLNESYFVDDDANYDSGNQTKEIKAGTTIEVEIAYELDDTTTDIEVEVSEFISWNDDKISKTFALS